VLMCALIFLTACLTSYLTYILSAYIFQLGVNQILFGQTCWPCINIFNGDNFSDCD